MRNTNFERHFSFVHISDYKGIAQKYENNENNIKKIRSRMGMQIIDVCCLYTHDTYSKKSCTNKRTHSLQLYKKAA